MTNPLLAEIQRLAREGYGYEDVIVQIERTMHRLEPHEKRFVRAHVMSRKP